MPEEVIPKQRFKKFEQDPGYSSFRSLEDQVNAFFDKYKSYEIKSQSQSQSGSVITLCVFYTGILDDTE